MKRFLIIFILFSFSCIGQNHISYLSMHANIDKTLKENERQNEIHEKTVSKVALNTAEMDQTRDFKELYNDVRSRLNIQPWADLIPLSFNLIEKMTTITEQSELIFDLFFEQPLLDINIYLDNNYLNFIEDATDVMGFILGVMLSIGSINQMEQDDRRLLLDHMYKELNRIIYEQYIIIVKLKMYKYKSSNGVLGLIGWTNDDMNIINQTIDNFNLLVD